MRPSYNKETTRAVSGRLSLWKPPTPWEGFATAAARRKVTLLAARELSPEISPGKRRLLCCSYPKTTPPELRKQVRPHRPPLHKVLRAPALGEGWGSAFGSDLVQGFQMAEEQLVSGPVSHHR